MQRPLGSLDEVSLVIHDGAVYVVSWVDAKSWKGYPIMLDSDACLKWSIPALRPQLNLQNRSFLGCTVIVPTCGVAHRRTKVGRPQLSVQIQRVRTMCLIAVNQYETISPVCAFCGEAGSTYECFLCTSNVCKPCDALHGTISATMDSLPRVLELPACMHDPELFKCTLCKTYLAYLDGTA